VYTGPTAPWQDFTMENRHWVIVLSAVCGFWICLAIFLAAFCGPHQFTCHLCEEKIPRRMWQSGEHRPPCAKDHERFLYELPDATQKSAKCPTCGRTLKVSFNIVWFSLNGILININKSVLHCNQ